MAKAHSAPAGVTRTLRVDLGERGYAIHIGRGLLGDAALPRMVLGERASGGQVAVVTNETVAPLHLAGVRDALRDASLFTEIVLPDGERHKNLDTLSLIFDRLLADGHNRGTTIVALGGGVVGDMAGFAAATYQRGVRYVQVPTTLLSQVDSSVGGKTGVNHPLGKNMIGAFHQPRAVLIDIDTLGTLPKRELSAGLAEVIKYGLICDKPFYHWLQEHLPRLLALEEDALVEAIERSCANKAAVVAADEREAGQRAILNLGHTFGHAIETAQGYGEWLHGEAVAAGMVLALRLSAQRGAVGDLTGRAIGAEDVATLTDLLERAGLPTQPPPDMTAEDFLTLMQRDKKVIDGRLRLVLLEAVGRAVVTDAVSPQDIHALFA